MQGEIERVCSAGLNKAAEQPGFAGPDSAKWRDVPVALVVYNRPGHTLEVLNSLKKHGIKNLYIFSDAPKKDEHKEGVLQVRQLLREIDWTTPKIIERTKNFGLARSIVSAADYVFQENDRLILLEDDCVPQQYFFDFVCTCLEKYKDHTDIFGVTGYSIPISDDIIKNYQYDLYFCPRICSWGWATWKRAWQHYGRELRRLVEKTNENKIDLTQGGDDIAIYVEDYLRGRLKDVWTLNWEVSVNLNNGYYIYPTRSHLRNVGMDGTGVHCSKSSKYESPCATARPVNYPQRLIVDENIIANMKSFYRTDPEKSRKAAVYLSGIKQQRPVATRKAEDTVPKSKRFEKAESESFNQTQHAYAGKGLKVAEDYVNNGMKVDTHSLFGESIKKLFARITPQKVIETGTYLGTGTTTIIAGALKELGIKNPVFCTIEVNPEYYDKAKKYFRKNKIEVHALNGLSIPRSMLPSREDIARETITSVEYGDIFVDHREQNRAQMYYRETDFPNAPDNLLYKCLEVFDFKPDFVLLDSAGHLGNIEFDYLIEHLKGECFIALDDINHIKHHRDFLKMQSDERFEIIEHCDEKFGFCIARFDPAGCRSSTESGRPKPKKVLLVRPDSIGDFVLFADSIRYFKRLYVNTEVHVVLQEHIAELAETCPDIDRCIAFDVKMMKGDKSYSDWIMSQLKEQKYDLAIYPVYSRTPLGDSLTLESGAAKKIAVDGDSTNIAEAVKLRNDACYTRLVPAGKEWLLETSRTESLVRALGVEPDGPVIPRVWLTNDDIADAEQLLTELKVKNPVVLCPFGQNAIRHWPDSNWAQLLSKYKQLPVLICGAANNREEAERIIRMSGHHLAYNLCGKTGLRQMAAILTTAKLCVGVESAAGHIAAAVGCPHVIIIGGGHFGRFMPYSPLTMLVFQPMECFRCNWLCTNKFQKGYCITRIRVETVDKAMQQALQIPRDKWTGPVLVKENNIEDCFTGKLELSPDGGQVSIKKEERIAQAGPAVNVSGNQPLVSAVVSTYNAEKNIRGCLEDLENQTMADKLQIVVVNSGSEQNEEVVVKEFQKKYGNIVYIKTDKRETIYSAWNKGVKIAAGKYITNANTDDRHCRDAFEAMAGALEQNPDKVLVYGDNEVIDPDTGKVVRTAERGEFSRTRLLDNCFVGPQPMWRRELHDEFGYFDENFFSAGDYEFWLRISQKYDFLYLARVLGQYECRPESIEHDRGGFAGRFETALVKKAYQYSNVINTRIGKGGITATPPFIGWCETNLVKKATTERLTKQPLKVIESICDHRRTEAAPILSIIIAACNRNDKILESIDDLYGQSERNFELIVVNNGRPVTRLIEGQNDPGFGVCYVQLDNNYGPSLARNIGAGLAKAPYIAFLDDDAIAGRDFVRNIVGHLSEGRICGLRGKALPRSSVDKPDSYDLGDKPMPFLVDLEGNCAFRKDAFLDVGGFNENLYHGEGYDISYRIYNSQNKRADCLMYFPDVVIYHDPHGRDDAGKLEKELRSKVMLELLIGKDSEIGLYVKHFTNFYPSSRGNLEGDYDQLIANVSKFEKNHPELALTWALKAIAIRPEDVPCRYVLGRLYVALARYDMAEKLLEPLSRQLYSAITQSDFASLGEFFTDKVAVALCFIDTCMKLGYSYAQRGQTHKAVRAYSQVLNSSFLALSDEHRNFIRGEIARLTQGSLPVSAQKQIDVAVGSAVHERSYLVSAIVSTYNSERFISGCLEDLENQTIADKLEIIVVDSGSQQNEQAVVREFQRKYDNVKYIRTDNRETIYAAWNKGVKMAAGKYITNANTDDRHNRDAFELMADALQRNPDKALVYGDYEIIHPETGKVIRTVAGGNFASQRLLNDCFVGPQPMWRRDIHDEFGYFDDVFFSAGDYEFWLRIAQKYGFLYLNRVLGQYRYRPDSVEHEGAGLACKFETLLIKRAYQYANVNQMQVGREGLSQTLPFAGWPETNMLAKVTAEKLSGRPVSEVGKVYDRRRPDVAPALSVIIVTYNHCDGLLESINSLARQNESNFELIVVNNGRPVAPLAEGRNVGPFGVCYVELNRNFGPSLARNFGVKLAKAPYLAFLDDDAIVPPDYVSSIMTAFQTYDIYGLRGRALPKSDPLANKDARCYDRGPGAFPTFCDLEGCSAFVKDAYLSVDGMDPLLFGHEGIDLTYRIARKFGAFNKIIYWPSTVIFHDDVPLDGQQCQKGRLYRHLLCGQYLRFKHKTDIFAMRDAIEMGRLPDLRQVPGDKDAKISPSAGRQFPPCEISGNPLVSIVITAYNAADYIGQTIESALVQNYKNIEIVVVDDGSTDRTAEIVRGYSDRRIKYFFKKNGGVASARNFGFKNAAGSFIVMLDSDDMMTPDYLAGHLQVFERYPRADMVYCDDCLIDEENRPIRVISRPEYSDANAFISDMFRCGFPVVHFKTCIRRSVFDEIGYYDDRLAVAEDYDMMRRFIKQNLRMIHFPAALYLRRISPTSLSRGYNAAKAKSHFEVIRRFTETFTPEQLFPEVQWQNLSAEQKLFQAKFKTAVTFISIGKQYTSCGASDFVAAAVDQACAQLGECLKVEPENPQLRHLWQQCRAFRDGPHKSARRPAYQSV